MNSSYQHDTIAAIATAKGLSGIGIVKLSGPRALDIVGALFRSGRKSSPNSGHILRTESHRLYHGWLHSDENGEILDEVLVGVMLAPHSYTAEDVVEINSHGGYQCLKAILEFVLKGGARLAEPGEFTRRAWLNGRIDLCQAEAVAETIHSRSTKALQAAGKRLEGGLGRRFDEIREAVAQIVSEIEAGIEFGEEIEAIEAEADALRKIQDDVLPALQLMMRGYRNAQPFVEGLRIAVIGCPNVGKSSLVNRLVCADRVLVSDRPGTTRDRVDIFLKIGDLPLILTDTAGLGQSQEVLDLSSMEKTVECLDDCEIILFVLDAGRSLNQEDEQIRRLIENRNVLLVYNKMDLVEDPKRVSIPESWPKWPMVKISARYDKDLCLLEAAITDLAATPLDEAELDVIPNLRQHRLFELACEALERAAEVLDPSGQGEALAVSDLKEALSCLDDASGRQISADSLDRIFAQFCIGK